MWPFKRKQIEKKLILVDVGDIIVKITLKDNTEFFKRFKGKAIKYSKGYNIDYAEDQIQSFLYSLSNNLQSTDKYEIRDHSDGSLIKVIVGSFKELIIIEKKELLVEVYE